MVAIVAGSGLGLFDTSSRILGGAGMLGESATGQDGSRSYVNAATGNLILQVQDELLSGRGLDLPQVRTYNSQGKLNGQYTDGDADGWRWAGERTIEFTAGPNGEGRNVGGTVTRTTGDGHVATYHWDAAAQTYVSTDGDGAHDYLTYQAAGETTPAQWIWTDGTTRQQDIYGDSDGGAPGRLLSQTDVSGNRITFTYSGDLVTEITDLGNGQTPGQKIKLLYAGSPAKLVEVDTYELPVDPTTGKATSATPDATPIKQVEYTYDNGRLATVRTLLSPGAATSTYFVTTYQYVDSASPLIKSITQNDGSTSGGVPYQVNFTYDADNRIRTVTDASGTETFTYNPVDADTHTASTDITLSDANGDHAQTWTFTYNVTGDAADGQLARLDSPAPTAGAARLTTQLHYDTDGNVDQITDALGNRTIYRYDDQGNRVLERDELGNTITRMFDANNQLLTETHYTGTDSNLLDVDNTGTLGGTALTTHYAYDASARLRFVVSPEGRVTESRGREDGDRFAGPINIFLADVVARLLDASQGDDRLDRKVKPLDDVFPFRALLGLLRLQPCLTHRFVDEPERGRRLLRIALHVVHLHVGSTQKIFFLIDARLLKSDHAITYRLTVLAQLPLDPSAMVAVAVVLKPRNEGGPTDTEASGDFGGS